MADGEVFRKESKRWVAPQTSYDGDDWGTEYDEYDDYNEYADYVQNGALNSPPQQAPAHGRNAPDLKPIGEEEPMHESGRSAALPDAEPAQPSRAERRMSQKRKEVPLPAAAERPPASHFESIAPLSHSKSNSVTSTEGVPADNRALQPQAQPQPEEAPQEPAPGSNTSEHAVPRDADAAELGEAAESGDGAQNGEPGGSLQDIYGFYESRYPQHPYSAMVPGLGVGSGHHTSEFSDSTASLSTGRRSLESGAQDSVYSGTRERVGSIDYQSELDKVPEVQGEAERPPGTPKTSESGASEAPDVPESPYVLQSVERLHIAKTPGHSRNASLEDDSPQRPLSHVDDDIAEMYEGTSAFLDRPISTYMSQPISTRDISDASIRELLTPQAAQSEFEPAQHGINDTGGVPSLFITEASPDRARKATEPEDDAEPRSAEPHSAPAGNFAYDHDYVDASGDSDENGEPSDDDMVDADVDTHRDEDNINEHIATTQDEDLASEPETVQAAEKHEVEPFILPSERNRLQPTRSASSAQAEHESASDTYLDSHMSPLSGMSHDSGFVDAQSGHARDESQASGVSAGTGATDSVASEGVRDSDANSASNATGVTSASDNAELGAETGVDRSLGPGAEPETRVADSNGAEKAVIPEEQPGPQSVAAKVKRPPPVDFSALFSNTGGSSESRCEQLRLLRTREAEYSSGLETWLTTTYAQIDATTKVFVDGVPSKTQTTANHDTHATIAATAKMSSVVHSSASNTKEKLGKVGNKSKSFFAKVMR